MVLKFIRGYDAKRYRHAKDQHRWLYVADFVEREAQNAEPIAALDKKLTDAGVRANAFAGIDHCVSGVLRGDDDVVSGLREFIAPKDFRKLVKERKLNSVATVCAAFFYGLLMDAANDRAG